MPTGRTLRLATAVLVLGLAASACGGGDPDGAIDDVPVGTPTPGTPSDASDPGPVPPTDSAASRAPRGSDDPAVSPTGHGGGEDGDGDGDGLTPADDTGGVGANARAMLRGDRPTLVVEIDTQQDVDADADAVAHLTATLGEVVDKPGGIVREGGNELSDPRTTWSSADLRAVAADNRDTRTTDEQVSVHVLYVAGSHVEDGTETNAIGLALSASTIAIFPQRWQGMTSLLGSGTAIERAVLVHELGHLLSLVNLGYESDLDHEDPDHPGHSANQRSAMYYAVETTLIGQVFSGPPPDTFDDADRSDLDGLRTGRL